MIGRFLCWLGLHKKQMYYDEDRQMRPMFACIRYECYWRKREQAKSSGKQE